MYLSRVGVGGSIEPASPFEADARVWARSVNESYESFTGTAGDKALVAGAVGPPAPTWTGPNTNRRAPPLDIWCPEDTASSGDAVYGRAVARMRALSTPRKGSRRRPR